jgi:hypothetical protein
MTLLEVSTSLSNNLKSRNLFPILKESQQPIPHLSNLKQQGEEAVDSTIVSGSKN